MDPIMDLAREHGMKVIDDAAHAFPSYYKRRPVGSLADATAFSFYSTKTLATGEGGMLTTAEEHLAGRVRMLSLHGMSRGSERRYERGGNWSYDIEDAGYKYNMPELAAALGLVQLARREEMLAERSRIAERYFEGLRDLDAVRLPTVLEDRQHCWHLFIIKLQEDRLATERNRFIEELKLRNIGASVHFRPIYRFSYYRRILNLGPDNFPGAEAAYRGIVSLPIWPGMADSDVDDVIDAIRDIAGKYKT
jgi:dTDP-4-amino-4,6-dideoxygalactose transaminase